MYTPPQFLTPEVLAEVLGEFEWPATYVLEDNLPDSIDILLPRCHLFVMEGFESEMTVKFDSDTTGLSHHVSISQVLIALREDPGCELPPPPALSNYFSPSASLAKVKHQVRDQLLLLFTYFRPSLTGSFDWAPAYRAYEARHRI